MEAIRHWGPDYRFETSFFYDPDGTLWVKGSGDPYLTSEELHLVVSGIQEFIPGEIKKIGVDGSYYETGINIPGREPSKNPYDAPSSALAANFNTVTVKKYHQRIRSAEKQTPLSPTARHLAADISDGTHRISIPFQEQGVIHFGELLGEMLTGKSLMVMRSQIPQSAELFYTHTNSHDLENVVESMLRYSNNFIANQLFLNLGAAKLGAPATLEKGQRVFQEQMQLSGVEAIVEEGSGLSRNNRLSAQQLVSVLGDFQRWKDLLPQYGPDVYAKTGTLNGVRTLAGFAKIHTQWQPFAIFVNEQAPRKLRHQVLNELMDIGEQCHELSGMTITRLLPRHESVN